MSATIFPVAPVHWRTIPDWSAAREFHPMRSRWLYVFQRPEVVGPSRLIRELWVDEDNRVCTVLEGDDLDPVPVDRRPAADPATAQPVFVLPDVHPDTQTSGRWVFAWYRLIASPIRLGPGALEALRAGHTGDLAQDEVRLSAGYMLHGNAPWWFRVDEDGPLKGMFVSRAVDALHLLGCLQVEYAARLFTFQKWDIPLPPAPPHVPSQVRDDVEAQRQAVLERQKQHALMELIEGVLASDPDDAGGLRGCLDLAAFERDVSRVRDKRAALVRGYEEAAEAVTEWLASDFMLAAEQAHEETGDPLDVAAFLTAIHDGMQSLNASKAGIAYLRAVLDDPEHLINRYVLPPGLLDGDPFQAVRKAVAAVVGIHAEVVPVVVLAMGREIARQRLLRLNNALGEEVLSLVPDHASSVPSVAGRVVETARPRSGPALVPDQRRLEALLGSATGLDARTRVRLSLVLERALVAVDALNLASAVLDQMDADDRTFEGVAGLLGSTLDLAVALENPLTTRLLLGTTEEAAEQATLFYARAFKLAGGVSAVIDIVLASMAIEDARQVGDESVMLGNGLVAVGSGLGLAAMLVAGTALAPWLVGAGVLLVAAGTILVAFTTNTPWQMFFEHCQWGRPGMWAGTDTPNWSPVPLDRLKASLDHQIEAVMNLFVSCTLAVDVHNGLEVTPGLLGEGATFQLVLHARWDSAAPYGSAPGSWRRYELELRWGQPPRVIDGDPSGFGATYAGRDGLSPTGRVSAPPAITGPNWAQYIGDSTWYVRLDLQGDGSTLAPAGKWLRVDKLKTRSFAEGTVLAVVPPLPTTP